ncbi:MAG: ThuA domain-containing protein [Armatimonadetes bacterium]|nr:ThuA domain-containing protein [Candidatus Hippobium faecium]
MIKVTVWSENIHEQDPAFKDNLLKWYPKGIHSAIAEALNKDGDIEAEAVTLQMPSQGLTDEVLANTDVLFWWGHAGHHLVEDALVEKIHNRVLEGMGMVLLHSAHHSKIFKKLMGTSCSLRWRETEKDRERVWTIDYSHPIAEGLPEYFDIPHTEMYGEVFNIPKPDDIVFISWYAGGEILRSGITYQRGKGKIFYFAPGHETFPIYNMPEVQKILTNAAKWATPAKNCNIPMINCVDMAEAPEWK